jgi:hypothetical protein
MQRSLIQLMMRPSRAADFSGSDVFRFISKGLERPPGDFCGEPLFHQVVAVGPNTDFVVANSISIAFVIVDFDGVRLQRATSAQIPRDLDGGAIPLVDDLIQSEFRE